MPDNYISQIDFGDGVVRKLKAEGGGGTGLYIGDVIDFSADYSQSTRKTVLTWSDPNNIIIDGVVQAEWAGTIIVRKEGSMPISSGDGVVVVNNTTKNQYSENGFEDSNIEVDTVYYYRAFPYTTTNLSTSGSSVIVDTEIVLIYGAEWDGTANTTWTRTDAAQNFINPTPAINNGDGSSPFDNIMPWSGMVIEQRTGGTMVKIPKFWYTLTSQGSGIKIQIAGKQVEGFSVSPAHMDRGDGNGERDYVYIGRYLCGSSYGSYVNNGPVKNVSYATCRTNIHNLGTDIWQLDFAMIFTIWLLYLVEYADWNSQNTIGKGGVVNTSWSVTGETDNMVYHTGTSVDSRSSAGACQYRHIESLWSWMYQWIDGTYTDASGHTHMVINPSDFGNASQGADIISYMSGFPKTIGISDDPTVFRMFIPTSTGGSETTYTCDRVTFSSYGILSAGYGGLFGLYGYQGTSNSIGARIMELPSNAQ